jgi:hypothetical protein
MPCVGERGIRRCAKASSIWAWPILPPFPRLCLRLVLDPCAAGRPGGVGRASARRWCSVDTAMPGRTKVRPTPNADRAFPEGGRKFLSLGQRLTQTQPFFIAELWVKVWAPGNIPLHDQGVSNNIGKGAPPRRGFMRGASRAGELRKSFAQWCMSLSENLGRNDHRRRWSKAVANIRPRARPLRLAARSHRLAWRIGSSQVCWSHSEPMAKPMRPVSRRTKAAVVRAVAR